jgi:hypothetical protein
LKRKKIAWEKTPEYRELLEAVYQVTNTFPPKSSAVHLLH